MKHIKIFTIIICLLFCISCNNTKNLNNKEEFNKGNESPSITLDEKRNGTADKIEGTTVIISIYANDELVTWNDNLENDISKIDDTINNLRIATDYLTKAVAKYEKSAKFIYDWHENSDLRYEMTFKDNIVDNYNYKYDVQREWIIDNIDIDKIKKKYAADNIVFVYFFNTDNTNSAITSTYNLDIDIVNVFPENSRYVVPPATYAHELLHTFGAPDLYYANATINQEYVDYLSETNSKDIMFMVTDTSTIIDVFSDLDAYYVGLIDSHPDVDKWGLGISEHIK